jgi:hypothetical protein
MLHYNNLEMKLHAHLIILSICISYFDDASGFKSNDGKLNFYFKEKLQENAHALYRALQFMYTNNYSVTSNQTRLGENY